MIAIQHLEPGRKVKLKGDIVAEIIENPRDGIWMIVRWLSVPQDPDAAGREELCYVDDVAALL